MVRKIKLIFISTLMLILILGLNTTVLGAKSWNINEFSKFIECMGYDVEGMDFSSISGYLSGTSYNKKIFRYEINEATAISKDKLLISFSNTVPYFNNGTTYFSFYTGGTRYILDFTNKTIEYNNGNTDFFYEAIIDNTNLTTEEFTSITYQKELIKKYCIFSDLSIKSNSNTGSQTIFVPQGGKITSSSYENTTYNGTITYIPSLRTVEWNLISGFVEGQEYALFLNEWTTSNDFEYGLRDYNDGYIVFNNINTLTGSRTISNFNFETRANQVYQFCIGLKSGDSNEYIELIKTDWLIPNDNTLFLYPNFSRSHYFQLLNLVAYNPDAELPPDTGGDDNENPSGDTGGGGTTTPDYSDDLDNIQTGISDINNNIGETNNKLDFISGELSNINNNLTTVPDISDTTITNDDITSNLDFEFEQDPYTNFWLQLTTGLGNAFTNSKREISIQFRENTHIISLDNFSVQVPSALKPFLTIISTVFITWKMLQYIKIIIDNISSGNIDEVLEMNEEEGITNLF